MSEIPSFEEVVRLAEKGLTPYQIQLGQSYLTGQGFFDGRKFPQDFEKARYWFEQAHKKGASTATYILGSIYEEGKGVSVDIPKAIALYELAVERGAYLPCLNLARIYANGKGGVHSAQLAAKWYQKVLSFEGDVDDGGEIYEARNYLLSHSQSNL